MCQKDIARANLSAINHFRYHLRFLALPDGFKEYVRKVLDLFDKKFSYEFCWATQETLGESLRKSRRQVIRYAQAAKALGLFDIVAETQEGMARRCADHGVEKEFRHHHEMNLHTRSKHWVWTAGRATAEQEAELVENALRILSRKARKGDTGVTCTPVPKGDTGVTCTPVPKGDTVSPFQPFLKGDTGVTPKGDTGVTQTLPTATEAATVAALPSRPLLHQPFHEPPPEAGGGSAGIRPTGSDEGGDLDSEETGDRELPEEAADCNTFTRDLDSGADDGGDLDSEETVDAPPAVVGILPCPTLADRIAELDELDDADTDDQPDILAELGLAPAQPDGLDEQTLPPIPAVDPEEAEAEAYWQQKTERDRQALSDARHQAAELDSSLQMARNTRLPVEKRVMHAANLVRGVERLAGLVGHRFRVWLVRSEVRFSNWSDECLAALGKLHPEVRTWDLFLALECVSEMNANCWRVAVKEEVWRSVAHWAEVEAGRRLAGELRIVSHGESSYMEAVEKFRAGLIDHYGERTRPPVAV